MSRPRKPTALKIAEGDQPCRINRSEPSSKKGFGPRPHYLGEVGRETWDRVSRYLEDMGIAAEVDSEALALYCDTFDRWVEAREQVKEDGMIVLSVNGSQKAHPLIAVIHECQAQMTRLMSQFGMTPSSRAGLHVAEDPAEDPLLAFIARKSSGAIPRKDLKAKDQKKGRRARLA